MPVAREKGGRRRTASSSSDCGLQAHFSPPKFRFLTGEWDHNDTEGEAGGRDAPETFPQCCTRVGSLEKALQLLGICINRLFPWPLSDP